MCRENDRCPITFATTASAIASSSTPTAMLHSLITNARTALLTILHTEVPKELEGRGIGSALVRGLLEIARAQGLKVQAVCPFVKAYLDRHPEYADLLS